MMNCDVRGFEESGYLLIRDVLSEKRVADLRLRCLSELARKKARLLVDIALDYPDLLSILDEPKLKSALTKLVGSPFLVFPLSSVDHNRFGQYHTDTSGVEIAGKTWHKEQDFRAIVVAIYLQDNNEHGGGIRLVPGTHRKPDPYVELLPEKHRVRQAVDASPVKRFVKRVSRGRLFNWKAEELDSVPGEIDIPTRAGDIVMWDMKTIHRASPNISGGESLPGGKIAIFFTVGRNNSHTLDYIEYIKEKDIGPSHGTRAAPATSGKDYILM